MAGDLPLVTLVAAATLDGVIAPVPVGSPLDRRRLLELRARHDASVIGASTLREADPRLLCPGRRRLRCLVTASGRILVEGKGFFSQPDRPVVFTSREGLERVRRAVGSRALAVAVGRVGPALDWRDILAWLGRRGVRTLLLEGGGVANGTALAQGVVDGLEITLVPRLAAAAGEGRPRLFSWSLAGGGTGEMGLRLLEALPQPTGELFLRYEVRKEA